MDSNFEFCWAIFVSEMLKDITWAEHIYTNLRGGCIRVLLPWQHLFQYDFNRKWYEESIERRKFQTDCQTSAMHKYIIADIGLKEVPITRISNCVFFIC